jgi:hypothetical protein
MKVTRPYTKKCDEFIPTIFDPIKLAYLAGIIDGEGCLWIGKLGNAEKRGYVSEHFRGVLKVSITEKELIDWLLESFQGTESCAQKFQPKAQLSRAVYEWVVTGNRLLDLCKQVLPYLVIKKEHCKIMIEFRETYNRAYGNNQLSIEALQIRRNCMERIRKLTSRSRNHPSKIHHNPSALLPVS